jgi:hypothetical protein
LAHLGVRRGRPAPLVLKVLQARLAPKARAALPARRDHRALLVRRATAVPPDLRVLPAPKEMLVQRDRRVRLGKPVHRGRKVRLGQLARPEQTARLY